MTVEQPTPRRRFDDLAIGNSPRARQRRLVRMIAADPDLLGWLATTKARTLHDAAAELSAAGHGDAADLLHGYAQRLARGDLSPF